MPIPYALNPLGLSSSVQWRNFYDNPITWTGFNALDFSSYASVRIELDFTIFFPYRGNSNMPIFGVSGGGTCPLFVSYTSGNRLLLYTYQSTGRYLFTQITNTTTGQYELIYTMTPGMRNTLYHNGHDFFVNAGIFSGYPAIGRNMSSADCTIQRLEVYGDDALIWQASNSDLTI